MKKFTNYPVDFVITWLDSTEKSWIEEKSKYDCEYNNESNSAVRFRDWGFLKYWFRSVEKYAPWVRKIFFVTYGHLPKWLNTNNNKISVIKHSDYIPNSFLPTYNSNVIELFFHKINDLSEHFVYFNDDMFLGSFVDQNYFFRNGIPVDNFSWDCVSAKADNSMVEHIIMNDLELLSKHYNKRAVERKNINKIFNLKNGKNIVKTSLLLPFKNFTGIYNPHVAQPYLKSSLQALWDLESGKLLSTAEQRFRSIKDYSLWTVRYMNLFEGNFYLKDSSTCAYQIIGNNDDQFIKKLSSNKIKSFCLNDNDQVDNFLLVKNKYTEYFSSSLPAKSSYEK